MKYVLIIGDGMADTKLPELAGKTPLEALSLPAFDRVAGCHAGRVLTVPHGMPAGSDTAILSIFGYAPQQYYTGRSVLEAAGMGIPLPSGSVSLRINLCAVLPDDAGQLVIRSHNGGGIHGEEARALMNDLLNHADFAALLRNMGLSIAATDTFRHIGVMASGGSRPESGCSGDFLADEIASGESSSGDKNRLNICRSGDNAKGDITSDNIASGDTTPSDIISDGMDLSTLCLTEPHNVLMQPIGGHLPRITRKPADGDIQNLCQNITRLMLLSHAILSDHPVNQKRTAAGKLPANMLWPWGAATAVTLPPFEDLFGLRGAVISAVPLVWGIARLAGLDAPRVEGANGELDTNYEGKADAAIDALLNGGYDFAAVHVEAPDEMAHAGDLAGKMEAIANVETRVVARVLDRLTKSGEDYRLMLISDHPTLMTTRMHDGGAVPFGIYDSRVVRAAVDAGKPCPTRKFSEEGLAGEAVVMDGTRLMGMLFERE